MKITQVEIKKSCRDLHGESDALNKAFQYLKQKYYFTLSVKQNKGKTIRIEMYVE